MLFIFRVFGLENGRIIASSIAEFLAPKHDLRFTAREIYVDASDGVTAYLPGKHGQ